VVSEREGIIARKKKKTRKKEEERARVIIGNCAAATDATELNRSRDKNWLYCTALTDCTYYWCAVNTSSALGVIKVG
jgi:hypothetical protein